MRILKISILSLLVAILTPLSALAFYNDVPTSLSEYEAIKSLYEEGRLAETNDNNFRPNDLITLRELLEMLIYFAADQAQIDTSQKIDYVKTALNMEIIRENENTSNNLNRPVSKIEALRLLFSNLGIGTNSFFDRETFPFKDIAVNSRSAKLAQRAAEIDIFEESSPTLFKLAKRITRAEAADYIYKIDESGNTSPATVKIKYVTRDAKKSDIEEQAPYSTLESVWQTLNRYFYYQENLDKDNLLYGAIEGLVEEAGDIYTTFERPEYAQQLLNVLSQEYEGVGMQIDRIGNDIVIVSPFKDSPAEKSGLKANDIITAIDGKSVTNKSLNEVVSLIKGKAGTSVKITVKRDGKTLNFTVLRAKISNSSVEYELIEENGEKFGYIELYTFGQNSYNEFLKAAQDLDQENPEGFIIDLRNNPGGLMDVAIDIASLFTEKVTTVVQLKYSENAIESYKSNGNGLLSGYDVVVLINKGSASASEILAGALHDLGIATLVGETSFGKGSVQQILQYSDGSLFKYTISQWLTPDGENINGIGIDPDIKVTNTGDSDQQLDRAIEELSH